MRHKAASPRLVFVGARYRMQSSEQGGRSRSAKMKKMRRFLFIIIALAFASGAKSAFGAEKLKIGYSGPSLSNAMLWITHEGKLFEKNGLDTEILYLRGSLGQSALIAGEIPIAVYTGSTMAPAALQGADVVMIAGYLNHFPYRLIVRPDIRSPADLKGKRVGITSFGTASDWGARLLLSKLGLNPEKDLTLLAVGDTPTRVTALIGKAVEATIIEPPADKKALDAGMKILADMGEMDIPFQHAGMVTTRKFIAKNPGIVERVVKATVQGIHLMRTSPGFSKQVISKYMKIKDDEQAEEAYRILRGFVQPKPYPTLEGFKTILAELSKRVPAAKSADPREFVDVRFLAELDRSGFIDGLYR